METIHYISDFKFFSGRHTGGKYETVIDALKSHIAYIGRKAKDVFTFNLDPKGWLDKAKSEIAKRWDSRVALKFVMALPLEVKAENVNEMAEILKEFISVFLNVPKENIGLAFHLHKGISGNYNPHVHVLVYPRMANGKKLRLNKKDLSEFHRAWQKVLKAMGYQIRKDDDPLPHLGKRLYFDPDVQELYRLKLETEKMKREVETIKGLINHRQEKEGEEGKEGKEFEVESSFFKSLLEKIKGDDFGDKQKRELLKHFQRLGYSPNDKLVVLLVNHRTQEVMQKALTVREILSDKVLRFLRAKNTEGYSVYASVNVLKPDATRRRKEDFLPKQKRIYLDLDSKTVEPKELIARLYQYLELKGLPAPSHIVKSSKGNYQVYWVLDKPLPNERLEMIMAQMNNDLGLDHTQDVARVFRLPYFRNKKPNKNDLVVNIDRLGVYRNGEKVDEIKVSGAPVDPTPFERLLELPQFKPKPLSVRRAPQIDEKAKRQVERLKEAIKRERELQQVKDLLEKGYSESVARYKVLFDELVRRKVLANSLFNDLYAKAFERNKDKSPSEVDLGFLGLLFSRYQGKPPESLIGVALGYIVELAGLRDKPDPEYYAQLTLEKVEKYWRQKLKEDKPKPQKTKTQKPDIGNDWRSIGLDL